MVVKKALLILNTYTGTANELGQPVLNDGKMMKKYLERYGYEFIELVDKGMTEVLKAIEDVLQHSDECVIYYSGHGAQCGYDSTEDDKRNEAFCFVNRMFFLVDDTLAECVNANNKTKKLILFNDCCHSGSIWDIHKIDIKNDQMIYNISACRDSQTAAQLASNGALTSIFWPNFKDNHIDYCKLKRALSHFGQCPVISLNGKELTDDSIEILF